MYQEILPATVLHWNYRGFTEFPIQRLSGEESEITDIYLKENLISRIPREIAKLDHLESLYLSGNDITELPGEISKLRCLKCLDVSGNRLRRVPDEIGEVRGLKFLILDENELSELPLRIAELRSLQLLSVCDNNLQWLPQRPVHNYHHCEFRFWRNASLKAIPYSLWYHMFREQQTRRITIGCLNFLKYQQIPNNNPCRLTIKIISGGQDIDVSCPQPHNNILENGVCSPLSLFENCKRTLYIMISVAANRLSQLSIENFSIYSNKASERDFESNNNVPNISSIVDNFGECTIEYNDNGNNNENANELIDLNGNNVTNSSRNDIFDYNKKSRKKNHAAPADIVREYFSFLPRFIRRDLCNGPISRCENVECKKPVFDYVFYEFCFGKLILIDNTEDVVLSATFCSKHCADVWKRNKTVLSWKLDDEETLNSLN